jgi:hypothetical protein
MRQTGPRPKRAPKLAPEDRCLMKSCRRRAVRRGLCMACYMAYRAAKRAGKVSETTAVRKGWILPVQKARHAPGPWSRETGVTSQ